jgi:signal transduction histidine kinase
MVHFSFHEGTRIASWAWDPASGQLFWSREHYHLFGLNPEDTGISYGTFFRMIHSEDRARFHREFRKAVREVRDFESKYRIISGDGLIRHIHSCGAPLFGGSDDLAVYVGTVADITEQSDEDSAGGAQAQTARVSRVITTSQLMAAIAHEVKQPLAALVTNANAGLRWLQLDPPRITEVQRALTRIVRDGHRASEVLSRIRALVGKNPVERKSLNLNSVVAEVIVLVEAELRRNDITFRANLDESLPSMSCDPIQLQQVLMNLVVNAMEAMITVRTRSRLLVIATTSNHAGVTVSVEDNGAGLDERTIKRIFEPFFTSKAHGMGIGLAISQSIIEAHGGRIWAERNKDVGSTFRFLLPFDVTDAG